MSGTWQWTWSFNESKQGRNNYYNAIIKYKLRSFILMSLPELCHLCHKIIVSNWLKRRMSFLLFPSDLIRNCGWISRFNAVRRNSYIFNCPIWILKPSHNRIFNEYLNNFLNAWKKNQNGKRKLGWSARRKSLWLTSRFFPIIKIYFTNYISANRYPSYYKELLFLRSINFSLASDTCRNFK